MPSRTCFFDAKESTFLFHQKALTFRANNIPSKLTNREPPRITLTHANATLTIFMMPCVIQSLGFLSGTPREEKNYCQVFEESTTCSDTFTDSQGKTMSYAACNFRKPEWNDEMTQCFGLSQDAGAPTAEICRVNCEEDDECEVYQFFANGACARGTSTSCSGPLTVIAGGRKAPPSAWTLGPKTGCDSGYQQPATWQQCQSVAAAAGLRYWGGSGHSSGADPKGCIYRMGDNDIYFNTHSTGSTNRNDRNTVCVPASGRRSLSVAETLASRLLSL